MPGISFDTITFFEIILCGFIAVWVFRHFTNSEKKYAEFEWFGLSAFWGLSILALWNSIAMLNPDLQVQTSELLKNPFSTGLTLSTFSIILGYGASRVIRLRIWNYVIKFFGKNGKDESGDIDLLFRKILNLFKD